MARITPFRAIRYDFSALGGDISARVAPPYDVLEQQDKDRLLAQSDRNIVAIDLPFVPPKKLGPAHAYEQAGRTFQTWRKGGTLLRETEPALYVYHQSFEFENRQYTRKMFIARLRLVPFSEGQVVPHEETFGGPKEDRLALMKATHANLSPVFGLYRDPDDAIGSTLARAADRSPDATATLDGVVNKVWIVPDQNTIEPVVALMDDRKCYIADGHHRYNTALNYRDWVSQQIGGTLEPDHPAQFIMVVLGSMDDPGSLILPTHRVLVELGGIPVSRILQAWKDGCAPCEPADADITLYDGTTDKHHPLRFTHDGVPPQLAPDKSHAWRTLDLAYLHRYLIDELLKSLLPNGPAIRYVKSTRSAVQTAKTERGLAVLCKPATMNQLRSVGEAGDLMPPKSTYFYPKVATGLTINALNDDA